MVCIGSCIVESNTENSSSCNFLLRLNFCDLFFKILPSFQSICIHSFFFGFGCFFTISSICLFCNIACRCCFQIYTHIVLLLRVLFLSFFLSFIFMSCTSCWLSNAFYALLALLCNKTGRWDISEEVNNKH